MCACEGRIPSLAQELSNDVGLLAYKMDLSDVSQRIPPRDLSQHIHDQVLLFEL